MTRAEATPPRPVEGGGSQERFSVGIDLGTTHCAVARLELASAIEHGDKVLPETMPIPQMIAVGQSEARPLLPSFLYLPPEGENVELALPWIVDDSEPLVLAGELARAKAASLPGRVVSSSKSWLCHPGIDPRTPVLPAVAASVAEEGARKLSPVDAAVALLTHLREAWDVAHPELPLSLQDVTLTVPASFDARARDLTAEAARRSGLQQVTLLEEPQAALYAWVAQSKGGWRKQVAVGDVILVIDVGGGTTDFSLIAVREAEGSFELHRVAVGEHILLGGDNMDLALAHRMKVKLGRDLDAWQMHSLTHACRAAKESLLGSDAPETAPIVVVGRGTKLIGGTLKTELTRAELEETLVDGFFPKVESSARPIKRPRAGLRQLGLPYADDAGITRHLSGFLARHLQTMASTASSDGADHTHRTFVHPTAVLFNGGVMRAAPLRRRTLELLDAWTAADGGQPVRVLEGADLDLAVARGAAYMGAVRRGRGIRIRGGTVRSYYVGIESSAPAVPGIEPEVHALCVAPFGMEEGQSADEAPQELGLVVGERAQFRFFGSTSRREDRPGAMLERWAEGELEELAPIETTLSSETRPEGDVVPVHLRASLTDVGTLLLEAVPLEGSATSADERWKLELTVREEG
ncbi:MAG: Hsp70 family protein [Deltaproteobacteria bacterium]|nr:Hsp70 family protein [Deltaproteobacteria bacterium]